MHTTFRLRKPNQLYRIKTTVAMELTIKKTKHFWTGLIRTPKLYPCIP